MVIEDEEPVETCGDVLAGLLALEPISAETVSVAAVVLGNPIEDELLDTCELDEFVEDVKLWVGEIVVSDADVIEDCPRVDRLEVIEGPVPAVLATEDELLIVKGGISELDKSTL